MKRAFSGLALLTTVGLASCARTEAHHSPAEGPPVAAAVVTAHEEELPTLYLTSGTVRGRSTTVLTSKTMGYIRAVRVRAGDHVSLGQPLVELEANDVRASVARARAALAHTTETKSEADSALVLAHADAKVAKSSYDRAAKLFEDKAIPPQQFDEAEARWHTAEAQERMAQARVRMMGSSIDEAQAVLGEANATLGYGLITAPFTGRVLERRVDPGALAAPGTPLLVVADEGGLRVEASVEESHANDVKVGDEVDVTVGTARPITAKVGEVVPSVDVASRAFLMKVELPPEVGALHPGTFARVGIRVGRRPRLVVPTSAVTSLGALDRVFVVEGGHAHLRMITRGETIGTWTEVLSGLAKDERVVGAPPQSLRDGSPVEVRP